jgi:hypothetical protein
MKVLRICVIVLILQAITWCCAYAESSGRRWPEVGKTPRQTYLDNRGEHHTQRVIIPRTRGKKKVYIYECIDSETGEKVKCPEDEEEEGVTEEYGRKRHD